MSDEDSSRRRNPRHKERLKVFSDSLVSTIDTIVSFESVEELLNIKRERDQRSWSFEKNKEGNMIHRILSQILMIFSSFGSEGGLFVFIGILLSNPSIQNSGSIIFFILLLLLSVLFIKSTFQLYLYRTS